MKIVKPILFAIGFILLAAIVICLAPFIMVVLCCYIIFAYPKELEREHERKMFKLENGHVATNKKLKFPAIVERFTKLGKF